MNEIQLSCNSTDNLFQKELWIALLEELNEITGFQITHLDDKDPIRKKVTNIEDAAEFIVSINEGENSRKVFGKFGKSKIEINIALYREITNFPNTVSIYFPEKYYENLENIERIIKLFLMLNEKINSFYAFCDYMKVVSSKRKASGFAVDLQAELIGIFWLTFFSDKYVKFIGQDLFQKVPGVVINDKCEALIKLGNNPSEINITRADLEVTLGKDLFVDPELQFDKPKGKYALKFEQL